MVESLPFMEWEHVEGGAPECVRGRRAGSRETPMSRGLLGTPKDSAEAKVYLVQITLDTPTPLNSGAVPSRKSQAQPLSLHCEADLELSS